MLFTECTCGATCLNCAAWPICMCRLPAAPGGFRPSLGSSIKALSVLWSAQLTVHAACPQLPLFAGPGAFDFKQGDTNGTAFWRVVRNFLRVPSRDQEQCQLPKPILLDTGNVHLPYDWCVINSCALLLAATLSAAAVQS